MWNESIPTLKCVFCTNTRNQSECASEFYICLRNAFPQQNKHLQSKSQHCSHNSPVPRSQAQIFGTNDRGERTSARAPRKRRRVGVRGAALAKRTNSTRARNSNAFGAFGALCAFTVLLSCDLRKLSSSNALKLCKISSLRDARRNCFERSLFSHAKSHKLVSALLCKFISVWNFNKHSFLLKLPQYI